MSNDAAGRLRAVLTDHIAAGRLSAPRYDEADITAVLDEREQLAAKVAHREQAQPPLPRLLRYAWRNGWDDHGAALRQAVHEAAGQRDERERDFARDIAAEGIAAPAPGPCACGCLPEFADCGCPVAGCECAPDCPVCDARGGLEVAEDVTVLGCNRLVPVPDASDEDAHAKRGPSVDDHDPDHGQTVPTDHATGD